MKIKILIVSLEISTYPEHKNSGRRIVAKIIAIQQVITRCATVVLNVYRGKRRINTAVFCGRE